MSEMVERVARAIASGNGDDYDAIPASKAEWVEKRGEFGGRFRDFNQPRRNDYVDMARAAIAAMREPTSKMICAALDSTDRAYSGWWREMIDAALRDKSTGDDNA
jgi:hypothetical protein